MTPTTPKERIVPPPSVEELRSWNQDPEAREAHNAAVDRNAWHRAAIAQAGRHAAAHPELVDDYSDADPGL